MGNGVCVQEPTRAGCACNRSSVGGVCARGPACARARVCASTRSRVGIRTVPEGVGCFRGAFALGQPRMGCMCGAACPMAPTHRCVAAPAMTCHGAPTQPEGLPAGPRHPEPLPMLGTSLSPGSPPGGVVRGSGPVPLISPWDPPPPRGVTSLQLCTRSPSPASPLCSHLPADQSPCHMPRGAGGSPWVSRLDPIRKAFLPWSTVTVQLAAGVLQRLLSSPEQGVPLPLCPAGQVSLLGGPAAAAGPRSGERGMR